MLVWRRAWDNSHPPGKQWPSGMGRVQGQRVGVKAAAVAPGRDACVVVCHAGVGAHWSTCRDSRVAAARHCELVATSGVLRTGRRSGTVVAVRVECLLQRPASPFVTTSPSAVTS